MKKLLISLLLLISIKGFSQISDKNNQLNDTIPAIILYSDSSIVDLEGVDSNGETYETIGVDIYSYWMKGYVVSKYDFSLIYLDENKKLLPTTTIVWYFKKR